MNINMNELILIAKRAGEAIMEFYKKEYAVSIKDDNSPITAADRAAHNIIMQGLKDKYGDIP